MPSSGQSSNHSGKACKYRDVYLTDEEFYIPAVVSVHDKQMEAAWFLATNLSDKTATEIVKLYGMRFTIEATFRDGKDIRFGMGLSWVSIKKPERWDRILLASAIATSLLFLLGAAG